MSTSVENSIFEKRENYYDIKFFRLISLKTFESKDVLNNNATNWSDKYDSMNLIVAYESPLRYSHASNHMQPRIRTCSPQHLQCSSTLIDIFLFENSSVNK
ncbi:Protein of unknown function [Cotesia congregata]|uniref:Uncharacterized protein n=1 Tax=Cotesia congregata TaxID=51543 RepID=A0A8J2MKR0_COTCN|nr:Protein of unknown function [Cotesia congregata]